MSIFTRRCLWLSLFCSSLVLASAWAVSWFTAPASGSMENLYANVLVGMTAQEAVAALQAGERDCVECIYVSGTDRRNQRFTTFFSFEGLPPASEIHDAELTVTCSTGESVEVALGEGGFVTVKNYVPDPESPRQYWLHLLHRTFGH